MIKEELYIKYTDPASGSYKNERVELLKSLDPNLTFNIADIAKPDQRKSDFSKTITLPSSRRINKIFEYIFEVNIDLLTFNPNLKTDVVYLVNGETNLDGYLQLKNINITDTNKITYSVVIVGRIGNFVQKIGDKYLTDLDLSSLDHTYTAANQVATWNLPLTTDYVYPMINYDINYGVYGVTETWYVEDFFPAITAKKYIDTIFSDAGFTYTSTFFDSTFFKTLIIPFGAKDFKLSSTAINNRIFKANTPLFITGATDTISFNGATDTEFIDPATLPYRATYNTVEDYDAGGVHNTTTGIFTAGETGFYNIDAAYSFQAEITTPAVAWANIYCHTTLCGYLNINKYNSSGVFQSTLDSIEIAVTKDRAVALAASTAYTTAASPTYQDNDYTDGALNSNTIFYGGLFLYEPTSGRAYNPPNTFSVNASNIYLEQNEQIKVEIQVAPYLGTHGNFSDDPDPLATGANFTQGGTFDFTILSGYFKNSAVNSGYVDGNTIDMNGAIPEKIKQKDFFMGIVKMFNLYVSADTDNETNLLIETREDFYQSGSANVVDWSQKLDHNKEMVFKPMGALDSKEYEYKYKIDKDYYNTLYNSTWNQVYGEKDHVVTNDFLKNTYSLEVIFSPTPSVGQQWYDRVIPTIIKYDDKKGAQQTQSNIRILQWGGLKATAQIWGHNGISVSDFKTSYPYAGMYNDPYTPTIDIGFGFTRQIFWDDTFSPITWTNNNLYNKYYSKFIEEITNVNSKIVTAYFYLKPTDIRNLSFRKIYRFNNAYFRLNKIENYNPTSPLTKCEFLKLKDANVFSPSTTLANGGLAELSGVAVPTYNNGNYTLKNGNSIGDKEVTVKGSNNYVNKSAVNIDIKGDDNKIFSRTKNIIIIGSGNTIQAGVENVSLINTNDLSVSISNTSFINGVSHNQGSMANVSVDTTAIEEVQTYLVDTTAGTVRITLPASPTVGKVWNFKKLVAANTVQVSPTSPSLIDGSATKNLTGIYDNLTIQWDGINFNII